MKNQDEINSIKQMIAASEENIRQAKRVLAKLESKTEENFQNTNKPSFFSIPQTGKSIEGIFNGEAMIDSERKSYPVPANYASKSKLVEGDSLKLTITNDGSFIYKQIGPVLRKRLVGHLAQDETGQYFVLANGRNYKVLSASVTYFKVKNNDKVVILIPREKEAECAAIENLVSSLDKNLTENKNIPNFSDESDQSEEKNQRAEKQEIDKEDLENSKKDFENDSNCEEENENKDKSGEDNKNNKEDEDNEEDLIDDPAKSIKDEWTPDLEEIKKEASGDFLGGIAKKFHI